MNRPRLMQRHEQTAAGLRTRRLEETSARSKESGALPETVPPFQDQFVDLFEARFGRLYRYLNRLSGEPELAADLAQETFVRLYRRGSLPDAPEAWLISVAMNLFRNVKSARSRHRRLLTLARAESVHSDPLPSPEQMAADEDARRRVRSAIDRLPEREGRMLLLQAEGYSYRDIAAALALKEASVGTLLARARRAFRKTFAGILLALGLAGVAYAAYVAPGSPLPAWARAVTEWIGGDPTPSPPARSPRAPARTLDRGVAGIAVVPGRDLVVVFTSARVGGQARVSLTDGEEVMVRALTGAATFTSDIDRLVIDNRGAATFEIQIPRAAPRVEIRMGRERIFLKEGARVTGPYLLPLTP